MAGLFDGYQFDPQTFGGNGLLGLLAQQYGLPFPAQAPQGFAAPKGDYLGSAAGYVPSDYAPQGPPPPPLGAPVDVPSLKVAGAPNAQIPAGAYAQAVPQQDAGGQQGPQNPIAGLLGSIGGGLSNLFSGGVSPAYAQAGPAPGAGQQPGYPAQPAAAGPGLFGRLQAGATNLSSGGNLFAGLINAAGGLATGERTDPQGIALKNQATLAQAYYQALRSAGIPDQQAQALAQTAAVDADTRKALIPIIHKTPQLVTTTDEYGRQHINVVDAEKGTQYEARQPGGAAAGGDTGTAGVAGSMDAAYEKIQAAKAAGATPEEMLQHVPKPYQAHVQGLLDGRELPASLGRGKNRENILGIAQAMGLDEGQLKARMEFAKDFGNTKTGIGFKLIAGGKVLHHLEGTVDDAIALRNKDVPSGLAGYVVPSDVIRGINAVGNNPAQQRAAAQKLLTTADSMSIEKGNFLSGQGGGTQTERLKTAAAYDPNSPRSNLAGAAEADLDLLRGQYASLNAQRDRALGVNSDAKKFQVLLPAQEAQMKRIQDKIDILKSGQPSTADVIEGISTAPANALLKAGHYIWDPKQGIKPK